ncbi:thiamine pyrophosphate-dependent dehydrogenase E1 component subunit alpha [Acidobacteria bacterium AH-259-G07]|nr:thiamine pyrophosphate-dependent dehydrogenase E1 component subunit alpha [Acidobacteria bacterium AH-259-G07]
MDRKTYEKLFYDALRIRMVEEKIIQLYPSDKIQSPVHLSIGQEHHVVALIYHLKKDDVIFCSYRSHAAYLAKGGDLRKMFAELYGKKTGMAKGRAGSMHLCSPEVGLFGASAIVGTVFPHALGAAYANKLKNNGLVSVVISGDGATEEGVFHECLNLASLKKLPVLFVIENNGLAIHALLEERQSYSLEALTSAYGIPYYLVDDGFNLELVWNRSEQILSSIRQLLTPAIFEIKTCRYYEHVGVGLDYDKGYRTIEEYETWRARDPLIVNKELVDEFQPQIEKEISEAVEFAELSPDPPKEELLTDVF